MSRYKLRAECLHDWYHFRLKAETDNSSIKYNLPLPDIEVEFDSKLSLNEIREIMNTVEYSHVMKETIAHLKEYTGQRN